MSEGNQDARRAAGLANKVAYTPMTAVELVDELSKLGQEYPNDYQLGLMVRAVVHQTHTNLKN